MIVRITAADRKRNPEATKGKTWKLISRISGKVLGYGSREYLLKRERQVQYFKRQH